MIWKPDDKIMSWLPKLQCHRGYWIGGHQQNSLESIKMAYELGYEITEFDVRMSSDCEVFLFHDAKLGGKIVSRTTYVELCKSDKLTTLRELFNWFITTKNFKLNIEIKNSEIFNYEIEKRVCELIKEFRIEERLLISSFNPLSLAKVRVYCPQVYRALLLSFEREYNNNWVVMSSVGNYFCYPHILHIRALDFLKYANNFKALAKKVPVVLWTVNDLEIYKDKKDIIHGVISDEITPEQFKTVN